MDMIKIAKILGALTVLLFLSSIFNVRNSEWYELAGSICLVFGYFVLLLKSYRDAKPIRMRGGSALMISENPIWYRMYYFLFLFSGLIALFVFVTAVFKANA